MTSADIQALTARQRRFFDTGVTLDIRYRIAALKRLQRTVLEHRGELKAALRHDLGRSDAESDLFELRPLLVQLRWLLRHLPRLCSGADSHRAPYGVTLILCSWCSPVLLTLAPLAAALAAGNTVILKPSSQTPETARLLARLLGRIYPAAYVAVLEGGREAHPGLLQERFDRVFFTGSTAAARLVQSLQPSAITEAGGKSPCIIHRSANLRDAARKVVFGKFRNCGQNADAPDYVLCDEDVREEFLRLLGQEIRRQYGSEYKYNLAYGRIVSRQHFDRLTELLEAQQVFLGGSRDPASLRIEPTVLAGADWHDPVMAQEILGPILPVLSFREPEEIPGLLRDRETPPALYLFARDKAVIQTITERCRFHGCCVGDAVLPLPSARRGFELFSRLAPLSRCIGQGLPLRYQPYTARRCKFVEKFFK